MGGIICELLAGSFFKRKPCCSIILMTLLTVFLPLVVLFFCSAFIIAGLLFIAEYILKKCNCKLTMKYEGSCYRFTNVLKRILIVLSILLFGLFSFGVGIAVGSVLFALIIVPIYILYIIILIKLNIKWKRQAPLGLKK